jgi:hypothetical protein
MVTPRFDGRYNGPFATLAYASSLSDPLCVSAQPCAMSSLAKQDILFLFTRWGSFMLHRTSNYNLVQVSRSHFVNNCLDSSKKAHGDNACQLPITMETPNLESMNDDSAFRLYPEDSTWQPKKRRNLTVAEKNQICQFHKDHPLVTHGNIAGI